MPKISRRYIITGSRAFPNRALVEQVVTDLVMRVHRSDEHVVIVHGACPKGADEQADTCAKKLKAQGYPVDIEEHPADWLGPLKKGAGPARNSAMAKRGAERCLAFWDGYSDGTLDMIRKAVAHKISVWIYPA